jgi:hypothetical protein
MLQSDTRLDDMLSVRLNSDNYDLESQNIGQYNSDQYNSDQYNSDQLNKMKQQVETLVSILKNTQDTDIHTQEDIRNCIKFTSILAILLFNSPLVIADLYYAYTDHSCVYKQVNNLYINLFIYLAVCGICGGIIICLSVLLLLCFKLDDTLTIMNSPTWTSLSIFGSLFGLVWTIIGSILFWDLINTQECDNSLLHYVFVQLIIKFIFIAINLKIPGNKL